MTKFRYTSGINANTVFFWEIMKTLIACFTLLFTCFSSTLTAQTWKLSLEGYPAYSLAVNPVNPSVIFAGGLARRLFRSDDAGRSWIELSIGDIGGTQQIEILEFSPKDTMVMFAAGAFFSGLERTSNGGLQWHRVLSDPGGTRCEFHCDALVFHPLDADTMFALRNSPPIVYMSTDAGMTWDTSAVIPIVNSVDRMRALTIAPDSTHIMLAGGRRAIVYRSTNGGKSFERTVYTGRHPDSDLARFRWSKVTPGKVYCTVSYSLAQNKPVNGGLWISTDYGLTWGDSAIIDTSLLALEINRTIYGEEVFVGGYRSIMSNETLPGRRVLKKLPDDASRWLDISDVPWTQTYDGYLEENVWDFCVTKRDGRSILIMATESGIYESTFATSVNDNHDSDPPVTIDLFADRVVLRTAYPDTGGNLRVYTLTGQEISSHAFTNNSLGESTITLSNNQAGVYVLQLAINNHLYGKVCYVH